MDLPLFHGGVLPALIPARPNHCRHCSDIALLGLLLYLLQQVSAVSLETTIVATNLAQGLERKEVLAPSLMQTSTHELEWEG